MSATRQAMAKYNSTYIQANPSIAALVSQCLELDSAQFWIDCSTMAPVIAATQAGGEIVLVSL